MFHVIFPSLVFLQAIAAGRPWPGVNVVSPAGVETPIHGAIIAAFSARRRAILAGTPASRIVALSVSIDTAKAPANSSANKSRTVFVTLRR